ncbi:hypothetical protein KY284_016299 [Solanum tuberosum]|nr:hypothetical protein KY284_016299 [Solanum tuberosum]
MVTNASSVEEQLVSLTRAIEGLTKYVQDQDARIFKLTDRVEGMMDEETSHAPGKRPQVQETVHRPTKQVEYAKEIQVSSEGTIPINQIREFIMGTIKDKYEFQQFDGKGIPKQHVEHFIETCNNVETYGDYLVKQFVCSLKGNAFDWYTDLEYGSIDSWEQMEQEFLNCFYSTKRTVSMWNLQTHVSKMKNQSLTSSTDGGMQV